MHLITIRKNISSFVHNYKRNTLHFSFKTKTFTASTPSSTMTKSTITFALVILTTHGIISHDPDPNPSLLSFACPPNETYSDCGNDPCENTCASPIRSRTCKAACRPGCMCKPGYLRNKKGVCVPYRECDVCIRNEIFDICGAYGCFNTCDEPDRVTRCTPGSCVPGCVCPEGYLRNYNRICVKPEDCRKCARDNEVFVDCGDVCPITCENKDETPTKCLQPCLPKGGCKCKPGFVRDWNGNCIDPMLCPKCDDPNEIYKCQYNADTTCATLGDPNPRSFVLRCVLGCYCKEGFARKDEGKSKDNKCIPVSQCPPKQCKTDPNAIIAPCGDPCPTTCENKDDPGPFLCTKKCIKFGCKCKNGYVLDKIGGKCILRENCPPVTQPPLKCGQNEHLENCPKDCGPETCTHYLSGINIECKPASHCVPACKCNNGHFRNEDNICVHWSKCCSDPNAQVGLVTRCSGGTCAMPEIQRCRAPSSLGCQCKPGYVKVSNTNSTCILKSDCFKKWYD